MPNEPDPLRDDGLVEPVLPPMSLCGGLKRPYVVSAVKASSEPSKPDDKEQSKRFIDTAKELGITADDAGAFGRLVGDIAPTAQEPKSSAKNAPGKKQP